MNNPIGPSFTERLTQAVFLAFGMLIGTSPAWAGNSGTATSITVVSAPLQVSVSSLGGPTFYVQYNVTVTNNSSNNNFSYDFLGTTAVTDSIGTPLAATATYYGSSGVPCIAISKTQVTCSKLTVNKGTSKSFAVIFSSPVPPPLVLIPDGSNLRFTVVATSNASKGQGYADTALINFPYEQSTVGFYTFVPKEGGVFFTGVNGNGGTGSPGGIATLTDPWTTTVVVPPINFTTTARAAEDTRPAPPVRSKAF